MNRPETAPADESFRARVAALYGDGFSPLEIAEHLGRKRTTVNSVINKLRVGGKLPPAPQLQPGTLAARALAMIELAGEEGRRPKLLCALLDASSDDIARALRRLTALGLIRREVDGLILGAETERAPETLGERRAAAGPLANVVSYALTLVQAGSPGRAVLFLHRAAERLAPGSPEAVNLLALADLIGGSEGRTFAGRIERIEIDGGEA
ncbi:MAG: hypothetical protein GY873_30240 [Bosea sp.]|uniref:terminase gpP N-terminus-related DNA-binding protein n=1 Tax=Bosea sp. (in: a-proteobacteria) TaxID=1871050 RepID=UPI00238CBD89|nr:hypothetical protein [Bosea sp. (in: a-proteobacteria)]MCP4738476.1 hypothetical protein [Bosea sp. (in: a-proteobacteria)]